MNDLCDLCGSNELTPAYTPPTTQRGLVVYVCNCCGLVQSLPRLDHVPNKVVCISSGAAWGNVRYGKGFRTEDAINVLSQVVSWPKVRNLLDVGANRGSFVLKALDLAPQAQILAVEPDRRIVDLYINNPNIEAVVDRIENVSLSPNQFDLVYCSHTLEHLASPRRVMCQIREAMKPNGILYAEVPNLAFIRRDDIVEEFFLDKHLYHFCRETLGELLSSAGFEVIPDRIEETYENLAAVATPGRIQTGFIDRAAAAEWAVLAERYGSMLTDNLHKLQDAARAIEEMARYQRVVVWGAGRIFDSLINYGRLNPRILSGVIDKHLSAYVPSVHGVCIREPRQVATLAPDVVVIASRSYYEEIKMEVKQLRPECRTIGLTQLMAPKN